MTIKKSKSWFASALKWFFGIGVQPVWASPGRQLAVHRRREARRLRFEGLESRRVFSLTSGMEFTVGANPQAITTADLNHDGWLDVITANSGESSVSVALSNGQGGFDAANSFATGTNPRSLAVGDFDNDGELDLATANPTSGDVMTLLGNGDGTFQAPMRTRTLDAMPMSLAGADFNQDGKLDLAVGSRYVDPFESLEFGVVSVLYGNGNGEFFDAGWYNLGGDFPADLAIADLNRDGSPDVVTADEHWYDHISGYGNVSVLLGSRFAPLNLDYPTRFATGISPQAVMIGDVTGDGILDLVTAGNTVDVLRGLGSGAFAAAMRLAAAGTAAMAVEFGDFNGEGTLDVVSADAETGNVTVFPNDGAGTFGSPLHFAAGSGLAAIAVADFNRDGRPDVAVTTTSATIRMLINDGIWPTLPLSLRIGDAIVNEGNTGAASATLAVTLSGPSTATVTVAYNTSNGTATAGSDYTATSGNLIFAPGETNKTITIPVIGDRVGESNETFSVHLSNPISATIADGHGVGTIVDDEPRISIGDVTKSEGKKGATTLFTFTVTLSAAYDQSVTMSFKTVDGTAKTGNADYVAKSGTLTFAPGETTKTITIEVKGDSKTESDETFYLDLFGLSSNALFTKNRGIGKILNDE